MTTQELRRKILDHVLFSTHTEEAGDYCYDSVELAMEIRELPLSKIGELLGEDPAVLEYLED